MIFRLPVVLAFLLLGGCVAAPPVYDSDPKEFSDVPETHGVVVFQAVTLDPRLNAYMYGWHVMRTSRLGGPPMTWLKAGEKVPVKYFIYPDYETIPGTSLWVGVLPAGNYLAEDFYSSFNNGQYYGHLALPVIDSYASFAVEPGRVTVLDTYLYKGFGDKHLSGNVRARSDLIAAATKAYPDVMRGVDTSKPLGFTDTREASAYDSLVNWARTTGSAEYADDGRVYRGARAGQIFERVPDGNWKRIALPTFMPVEHVVAGDDGAAIAITSDGSMWRRTSEDDAFTEFPTSFEGELQWLSQAMDGQWFAAVRRTNRTTRKYHPNSREEEILTYELDLLSAPSLEGPWKKFKTMPVEKAYADARLIGDYIFVGNPGGVGKGFHIETGTEIVLPAGFVFLRGYPDGTVLGYTTYQNGFWGREPAEIWMSSDHGATWTLLPDDVNPMGMPEYIGNGEVLMVGQRAYRTRKEIKDRVEAYKGIWRVTAGSRAWNEDEEVPEECSGWVEIRAQKNDRLLLCEYATFRRSSRNAEWFKEEMRGLQAEGEEGTDE